MNKAWKLIGTLILVVFVLGLICIGAGMITGAESSRIMNVLDNRFQLESTFSLYRQYFSQLRFTLSGLF